MIKINKHISVALTAVMFLNIECWGSNKESISPNGETFSDGNRMLSSQDVSLLHNPEDSSGFGLNSKRQYNEDSKEDSCTHTDKFRKTTADSKIDVRREQSKNRTQQTSLNSQKASSETLPQTQRTPNSPRSSLGSTPQSQQPNPQATPQSQPDRTQATPQVNPASQSTTDQNILDLEADDAIIVIGRHFKLHNSKVNVIKAP